MAEPRSEAVDRGVLDMRTVRLSATRALLAVALLSGPPAALAADALNVAMPSAEITSTATIGSATIETIGKVQFLARRSGSQLAIQAVDEAGNVIGSAQSFVGLEETPIYLRGKDGLIAFTIHWDSADRSGRR